MPRGKIDYQAFLANYQDEIMAKQNLSKTAYSGKKKKLDSFVGWLEEQPEDTYQTLETAYKTYLKDNSKRSETVIVQDWQNAQDFLEWADAKNALDLIAEREKDYIVGIGASAGGLEALERFFGSDSVNPKLTYVVIQHLSPDFKSMMPEILSRVTPLTIHSIEDGMKIEQGHIYLNTPRSDVEIKGDQFRKISQKDDTSLHLPINYFFRSLASSKKDKAIGIILSGTGRDGSLGVSEIHDQGGLVLAQDSRSAVYTSMPESAAVQGPAHLILEPSKMPHAIDNYIESQILPEQDTLFDMTGMTGENAFSYLLSLMQRGFGIDFTVYKNATLVRRVDRRMNLGNYASLEHYVSKLQEDSFELDALYRDMLVDVTSFFRDEEAFDLLRNEVIPELVGLKKTGDSIRIWSAACASGEEAYSMAMLFQEEINHQDKQIDLKVFATDAHKNSVLRASMAVFSADKIRSVPKALREKYFEGDANSFRIVKALRQKIIFAPHNLLSDGNFSNLDFVSCRNMLIYLKPEAQVNVLTQFTSGLNKEGMLFLGSSEHLGVLKEYYEVLSEKWRIYKKVYNLPIGKAAPSRVPLNLPITNRIAKPQQKEGWEHDLVRVLVPDGFVVDAQGNLVEILGLAKDYLSFRSGRVNLNLASMLEEPLATTIKSGLYNVQASQETLDLKGVKVNNEEPKQIDLRFIPFNFSKNEIASKHYFIQINPSMVQSTQTIGESEHLDLDRLVGLERELEFTRESLQSSLEEVETTNEELQSTNEELIASNEELQSTNEELSSVNEELITVNNEFQAQNKRLNQTNNDLENLLLNTETLAIFLDANLHIRMITPSAYEAFDLLKSDIRRPIHHFSHFLHFDDTPIEELCYAALKGQRRNLIVSLRDHKQFELAILPYLTSDQAIEGVVLRFFDITEAVEKSTAPLQDQIELLEKLNKITDETLYIFDVPNDQAVYSVNTIHEQLGYSKAEYRLKDKGFFTGLVHPDDQKKFDDHYKKLAELPDDTMLRIDHRLRHKEGHWLCFSNYDMVVERNEDGSTKLIMGNKKSLAENIPPN